MEDSLRIRILKYLKENDAVISHIDIINPFKDILNTVEDRQIFVNTLEYLKKEKLINLHGYPHELLIKYGRNFRTYLRYELKDIHIKCSITQKGEDYLNPKDSQHIVSTVYNFDNAVHPIIGDNNQSFSAQNINDINKSSTNPQSTNSVIKWILGIIATIIAGLIVWYITK